ncbi:hypothetical protein I6A84_38800 [Frankia sp. CNm7]|uniref:hypothetical protein n=1 Tax=Frankia nepalensis TaxID=1836974 RepID=UPI001933B58F|nr:hypothetical protein [Frankia nepalensis]MBL7523837.1 hypothetical protein [Frankia nepalensis]
MEPAAAPGFDSWLLVARHQVAAAHEARLRDAAAARLAAGQADDAVRYAAYAVSRNPFIEHNHELLARAFTMAGDHTAAHRQLALADKLRRRELTAPRASHHDAAVDRSTGAGPARDASAAAPHAPAPHNAPDPGTEMNVTMGAPE